LRSFWRATATKTAHCNPTKQKIFGRLQKEKRLPLGEKVYERFSADQKDLTWRDALTVSDAQHELAELGISAIVAAESQDAFTLNKTQLAALNRVVTKSNSALDSISGMNMT